MKNSLKVIIFYIVLIAIVLFASSVVFDTVEQEQTQYSDIIDYFVQEKVDSFILTADNEMQMTLKDQTIVVYPLRSYETYERNFSEIAEQQYLEGILSDYDIEPPTTYPWWLSLLPYLLVIIFFIAMWVYVMNQANGKGGGRNNIAGFGKARAKLGSDEKKKVLFSDVAGADEEKEELREIVDFLRDPTKFTKLGAKIPHGVLLMGPPGTGKTLLAKAVAGEANVPFYSISGSDFVEMYVGVGASRVRDLFDTAKKNPAAIIFIDEIDAVGRHRGAGLGGGHDEREQTLNQLLVEMDGFGGNDGVIVIAATNRPDILDPALLRPGRFDRQVTVSYPDLQGREDILKVHARNKPFEGDVSLREVAQTTVGFTGADLANLLNEAALLAARKGKHLIGKNDIEEATIKIIVGPQKKGKKRSEHDIKLTAYHEAGHAICTRLLPTQDPVTQISIIQSGRAGGYTLSPPVEDKSYMSKLGMEEEIVSLLGGRVAEAIIFGDISTGASNDIQRATNMARSMVTKYGMSDKLGPIVYGSEHSSDEVFLGRDFNSSRNYSEKTANEIDEEIRSIVDTAYKHAEQLLRDNIEKLHFIAEYLQKNEVMDGAQFAAVMDGNPTMEDLDAMVAEKRRQSEEENRARAKAEEEARKRDEETARARDEEERKKQEQQRPLSPMEQFARRMEEEDRRMQEEIDRLKQEEEQNSDDDDSDSNNPQQ